MFAFLLIPYLKTKFYNINRECNGLLYPKKNNKIVMKNRIRLYIFANTIF